MKDENAATVAPMPMPSTSTADAVKPGDDRIARNAKRTSWARWSSQVKPQASRASSRKRSVSPSGEPAVARRQLAVELHLLAQLRVEAAAVQQVVQAAEQLAHHASRSTAWMACVWRS